MLLARSGARALVELTSHSCSPSPAASTSRLANAHARCFTTFPAWLAPTSPPRDDLIRSRLVRLVDPETGSLSSRPQRPRDILASINRTQYWLVQVTKVGAEQDEQEGGQRGRSSEAINIDELPIVKLVSKKEAYDKQRAQKRAKASSDADGAAGGTALGASSAPKEVQLTWSSTPHDISHKLSSMVEKHLQRRGPGAKCTVVISSKKGKGRDGGANATQKAEIIKSVEDIVCAEESWSEISHARRRKDVEWQRNGSAALIHFEVVKGRPPPR
ncbi:hypothetical protein FA10DRAFT_303221 [Acaromyces ingoldii]|uniref:Translation initiation factor 3 N-terminal domain-containing protein n=1 Tax=Acaromyces ingoldii TaxID=215250 RepID=A0A316YFP6_9BASI|nr:hypothetical protein FA10DRAFT_303221 [Acaromyces ingoldii]PWN88237.1 hypothetical protein FA10DRAFT_303221 [Acaromyces ingoldii]